ncbi:MAG: polyprenol monophosphomannose synthase [Acidimicrobiia bacterium]
MRSLIILPTYNEIENIETVLTLVRATVPDADILVIDDGSPDGTAERAEKLAIDLGNIEVLQRPRKSGLGSAYRLGFRTGIAQGYDTMVEMDSDLSHDPRALPEILAPVANGAALSIGSRYVPGGRIPNWSWLRRKISRLGNRYARLVLGLRVQDATAGYRAYSHAALAAIDLDAVRADGYGFQIEMAYQVQCNGGNIVEVPIEFRDRELGTSKMSSRIVVEALSLVTWWGIRDRVFRRGRRLT